MAKFANNLLGGNFNDATIRMVNVSIYRLATIRMNKLVILSLVILMASTCISADSWALPEKVTVCSKNNQFCFRVIPKKLTSQLQYFEDKVEGKENAGAHKRIRKSLARGIFYRRDDNGILRKRWEINLVNEVSPVSILVADAGDYVVTFDNWHSVGYGDDVVVIYEGSTGHVVKHLALTDFLTEQDVNSLQHSTSSIWWGGKHSFDGRRQELVLQVAKNGKSPSEAGAEFFPVRIELTTGRVLDEVKDRFPSLRFQIRDNAESVEVADEILPSDLKTCIDQNGSSLLNSNEILQRAAGKVFPPYPPAAQAVRATGHITVGLVIDPSGRVACAASVTGHPLLRAAVSNAVRQWKFNPAEKPIHGYITFEGAWLLISPDGTVIDQSDKK